MRNDIAQFEKFEEDNSLFDLTYQGVHIWERIRHHIFNKIKSNSRGNTNQGSGPDLCEHLKALNLFLKNLIHKNPYFAKKHEYLFVNSGRRKLLENNEWWDIYCDPIYNNCNLDYLHLERAYHKQHYVPTSTSTIRYMDSIWYGANIQEYLGLKKPKFENYTIQRLESVQDTLNDRFNSKIDLINLVRSNLHFRNARLWMFRRLLSRINPSAVIIICSYGHETLVEACREQNIVTIELQHGVIHEANLGYSYKGSRDKKMFPDYLLTWSDYWKKAVEFPIPDNHVISVGFPYLENRYKRYTETEKNDQIIFLSQPNIGKTLSKFAVEVARHPSINYKLIYKLHPSEDASWETEYPWLCDTSIDVVDSSGVPLYQLFSESKVEVGVGSTAMYEGLYFDLECYIYDLPEAKILQPIIDDGSGTVISSPDELASKIGHSSGGFNTQQFFENNATRKLCTTLSKLKQTT